MVMPKHPPSDTEDTHWVRWIMLFLAIKIVGLGVGSCLGW